MTYSTWPAITQLMRFSGAPILHSRPQPGAPNFLFGPSDKISWNCELSEKSLLDAGIYVLFIKMFHSDTGEKINKKLTFYINRELN